MHHVRCVFGVCHDVAVSKYWYSSVCCLCFTTVMFVVLLSRLALMFLKELRSYLKCYVIHVCLTNSSVSLSPGLSNVSLLPPVSCSLQWISNEAGRLPKPKSGGVEISWFMPVCIWSGSVLLICQPCVTCVYLEGYFWNLKKGIHQVLH